MAEYVVISNLILTPQSATPYRPAHLDYMAKLKKDGKMRMAGRFVDGKGGLYILSVNSVEEAKALADSDPYHLNGVRQYSIREWEQRF